MTQVFAILQSRKFWSTIIGLLMVTGILDVRDDEQATWAAAISAGVTAIYTLSIAIEDGLTNKRVIIDPVDDDE